jgi:hypothetical protein
MLMPPSEAVNPNHATQEAVLPVTGCTAPIMPHIGSNYLTGGSNYIQAWMNIREYSNHVKYFFVKQIFTLNFSQQGSFSPPTLLGMQRFMSKKISLLTIKILFTGRCHCHARFLGKTSQWITNTNDA